jgi:hypothetical protein
MQYLKMDVAAHYGHDKENWDVRLNWTELHDSELEDLVPYASTPAMYHAAVQALRLAQAGKPSGYPISLDATASGLQFLSLLTGCEKSARLCNVVSTGNREDAYMVIYKQMQMDMDMDMDDRADEMIQKLKAAGHELPTTSREDVKQAMMCALYGSTAEPKKIFGAGTPLLDQFYITISEMAPGAWALNEALQALWQPGALSHDWIMPDNFHVHAKVEKSVTDCVQFLGASVFVTFSVNEGTKKGKALGPNIIHSVDGMVVREMQRRCSYRLGLKADLLHWIAQYEGHGMPKISIVNQQCKATEQALMLWTRSQQSGFLSARILECLNKENIPLLVGRGMQLHKIKEMVSQLPDKPFSIMAIHDCFRVLPNYGNDLRRQYNLIISQIASSNLLSFIASQVAGRLMPVNKLGDLSQLTLDAEYALS